jgi:hypothetical protein
LHRAEVAGTHPTFILDGLGPINPRLAISAYPDLQPLLSQYTVVARTPLTVVYRRNEEPSNAALPRSARLE